MSNEVSLIAVSYINSGYIQCDITLMFASSCLTIYNIAYMAPKLSQRRQVENEVVFRRSNEQVLNGLKELEQLAEKEGYVGLPDKDDIPVHFFCECSDENCRERIILKPSEYDELHNNKRHFVIKPNHEVLEIETVIRKTPDYTVVEKRIDPPEQPEKLHKTPTKNV